ncbi:MAG: bacteriohemerythrin, partial [Candidatus Aminicenantes bacterium]|nr:bacteriohemerythrin [Candidatus Aminicenantes bacterium]
MSEIKWDDSLSVGIEQIDDQHRLLIDKLMELSDAYNKGHEQNELLKTLSFLIDYTDFHFTTEEQEMEKHKYPGLAEQKKQHKEFITTLDNILDDYKD